MEAVGTEPENGHRHKGDCVSYPGPHNAQGAADKRIVVDVSAVSGQGFFTGVQRIVREFCESNANEILLVKWDSKFGVFRSIPRLSRLRYRTTEGFWGRLRVKLKNFYWNASKDFREQGNRRVFVPKWVRNTARRFYEKVLSDTVLERESAFHKKPVWQPMPRQTFVLLDIPVALKHIEALLELMESHEVQTLVYLHDLFPLTHRELFNKKFHPGSRAKHLRYLDVVTSADRVVCNSKFTLSQYERFTNLFENEFPQRRSVIYPPWPTFKERTDGSSETLGELFQESTVRILAVGAKDKRKNFVVLLNALNELVSQGVDARLVLLVGATGQADPEFRATLLGLEQVVMERVHFIQQVSDDRLVELYSQASVIAVPSLAEGFGLPVVEGLARQRPVVATRGTALKELAAILPVRLADAHSAKEWAVALRESSEQGLLTHIHAPEEIPADWQDFTLRLALYPQK